MKGIFILYAKKDKKKKGINKLSFNNELIIKKSKVCFNDPDPCIIHKTYCVNYLALELQELIESKYNYLINKEISITELPDEITNYLIIENDIDKVLMR